MPKSKTRAEEKDAITLLKEDHKKIREAAEKQDDKKLYYEALEEHHVVDTVLAKTSLTEGVLTKLVELVRPS